MRGSFTRINKKTVAISLVLLIAFAFLVYLFPYSGDDWAWGSRIGVDRLKTKFDNYNGRYAGNLLVMALTRSKLLNMITISISLVCVCLFPKLFASSKSTTAYLFGTLLFLLIPNVMLVQSVVWTAGFSNYVPPILLTFFYFILIRDLFEETAPTRYPWWLSGVTMLLGFFGALFMENVTLYNVAISGLILLYTLFKWKKLYWTSLWHFVGSVLGMVLMFSNRAYTSIANGDDGYRSSGLNGNLRETVVMQTKEIFNQFFRNNIFVLLIFSLLCVGVFLLWTKTATNQKKKNFGLVLVGLNLVSLFATYTKNIFPYWSFAMGQENADTVTALLFAMIGCLYWVTGALLVLLFMNHKVLMHKTMLLVVSIPVLILPLAVVTPIGPRCFFPPFFVLCGACVLLFVYLQESLSFGKNIRRTLAVVFLAGSLAVLASWGSIYGTIHTYDKMRIEYIRKQIDAGYTTVKVCWMPYTSYVWVGDPTEGIWAERYKLFYGIDENIQFEFVGIPAFHEWANSFDEQERK